MRGYNSHDGGPERREPRCSGKCFDGMELIPDESDLFSPWNSFGQESALHCLANVSVNKGSHELIIHAQGIALLSRFLLCYHGGTQTPGTLNPPLSSKVRGSGGVTPVTLGYHMTADIPFKCS